MAVAVGDQRRKREAMDLLVAEISRGEEENIANSLRVAIEVIILFLSRIWLVSYVLVYVRCREGG
jgi:hypothetical protein